MAKKRGLQTFRKAVKRTVKEATSKNPPFWADAFFYVAPAVASYTVTRLAGRASRKYLSARFPKARAFLPFAGSLAAAGALYYATSKVTDLKKYRVQILVGAGVALTQSLVLAIAPQVAWMFDLPSAPVKRLQAPATATAALVAQDEALDALEAAQAPTEAPEDDLGSTDEDLPAGLEGDDDDIPVAGSGWTSPLAAN